MRECKLSGMSGDEVRRLAYHVTGQRKTGGAPPKGALVLAGDLEYGLARMYETYLESDHDFRIFRDWAEAMEWLRPDSP
jgi:hypothetical protein